MLPLDELELKTAIEHDNARKWPDMVRLPDYPAARSLMRAAVETTMEAGDALFLQPRDLSGVRAKLSEAISKLEAARDALSTKDGAP